MHPDAGTWQSSPTTSLSCGLFWLRVQQIDISVKTTDGRHHGRDAHVNVMSATIDLLTSHLQLRIYDVHLNFLTRVSSQHPARSRAGETRIISKLEDLNYADDGQFYINSHGSRIRDDGQIYFNSDAGRVCDHSSSRTMIEMNAFVDQCKIAGSRFKLNTNVSSIHTTICSRVDRTYLTTLQMQSIPHL